MNNAELIKICEKDVENSISFFSNSNKGKREIWVVNEFLDILGISHINSEIRSSINDPPDVVFRDANFEIKELVDEGRKRHKEYKEKLLKIRNAKDVDECFEYYTPEDINLREVIWIIEGKLSRYKVDPQYSSKLDLLYYVNLLTRPLSETNLHHDVLKMPLWNQWRSVSLVFSKIVVTIHADDSAPLFIKGNLGKLVARK